MCVIDIIVLHKNILQYLIISFLRTYIRRIRVKLHSTVNSSSCYLSHLSSSLSQRLSILILIDIVGLILLLFLS